MFAQALTIPGKHVWGKVDPSAAITSYANKPPIVGSGPFQVTGSERASTSSR